MTKTSFADRWPPHPTPPHGHRLPARDLDRAARRVLAALLTGAALVIPALVLAGDLPGWALLASAAALLALPFHTYGWGLLETIAPPPEVRGPRHALVEITPHVPPGDDTLTALADSVGGNHARTETIPVVTP